MYAGRGRRGRPRRRHLPRPPPPLHPRADRLRPRRISTSHPRLLPTIPGRLPTCAIRPTAALSPPAARWPSALCRPPPAPRPNLSHSSRCCHAGDRHDRCSRRREPRLDLPLRERPASAADAQLKSSPMCTLHPEAGETLGLVGEIRLRQDHARPRDPGSDPRHPRHDCLRGQAQRSPKPISPPCAAAPR